jgi:replicative superfamily II helicase
MLVLGMVSYNDHLKKILTQTVDSYKILKEIQDKPGDLDNIKKEMLKINGFLKVSANNIDEYKITASDFKNLKSKFKNYLENYFFEKEIETMAPLYSNDVYRVKNMRLKIIEALEDKKMMEDVEELIEKL